MAWAPRVAFSSGILEAAAIKPEGNLTQRLLKLVRLQVSLEASCAFCFDMNAAEYLKAGLTSAEIAALQRQHNPRQIRTLSVAERLALTYACEITATPIAVSEKTINGLKTHSSEREILLLAAVVAQVNYWARFMQGLGVPPAGFSPECVLLPGMGEGRTRLTLQSESTKG